jgi:DNA-binding MarR family transcriptional regulator
VKPRISVFFQVFGVGEALGGLMLDALRESGLTPRDYAVYSLLEESGPLTPSEIRKATGAPLTTVSDWLRRYEDRGHLLRLENPEDGRSSLLSLTRRGRATWRRGSRAISPLFEATRSRLGASEEDVYSALALLRAALDETAWERQRPRTRARR